MIINFIRKSKSFLRAPNFLGSFGQNYIMQANLCAKDVGKVMISLDASCNVIPHTLFQKLNISLSLAKPREEIYWVNDNITDENSTHILQKIELHNIVHSKLSCEASKKGKESEQSSGPLSFYR